jgi:hypothetical protein
LKKKQRFKEKRQSKEKEEKEKEIRSEVEYFMKFNHKKRMG